MSDAQAGTPATGTESSPKAENQEPEAQDGSGSQEQKWQEALKWKQKAEEFNKVADEKKALEARLAEMERLAYARGAGQATDPTAEMIAKLREQAPYDPASQAALFNMEMTAKAQAEAWLANELLSVPESKRAQVAALVRGSTYQMSPNEALKLVTDPDASVAKNRLAELEAENARLREMAKQPNGSSPSMTAPAESPGFNRESIPWSQAQATLRRGGAAAKELRDKMDSNVVRIDYAS